MNVLHISGMGNWGGGENHIQNLCHELALSNPEINNIILCVAGGKFEQKLQVLPIKFYTAKRVFRLDPRFIRKIIKLCREESIDLIHLHDPTAMQLAVIADHFANLPPFILSRKISYAVKKNFFSYYKYNYKKIKKYLCVSEETKTVLADAVRDKSKILTIYHGTRIDNKTAVAPFNLREKLGIPATVKIIGTIANHYPAKDLPTFVRVVDRMINEYQRTDIHFVQLGRPTDQTPEILQQIKTLGLERHISLLGFVENASSFIPQFDIALMTSLFEGIPQFIYECFYFRVPVVTTAAGGTAEIIQHERTGLITDKGDDLALSKNLARMLDENTLITSMIDNAHQQLFTQYVTPVMAQKTLAVYREVLST